ncbi:hypothetical protein Poly21_45760 [Allorhodopirellula heiligendammensis]|uniref:Uncharacterized protein n=1 Tax=Allorhodopirellula heiligendammensis TaxID=2714739 RepID=A0A5C6BFH7_9BACT|nr:hypothetical protein Poly21_45760 [Allorhodopirellula heiligendammensis]
MSFFGKSTNAARGQAKVTRIGIETIHLALLVYK